MPPQIVTALGSPPEGTHAIAFYPVELFNSRMTEGATAVLKEVERLRSVHTRPIIVAIDGGSGSGKSTVAEHIERSIESARVPLDDFYTTAVPESEWPKLSVTERIQRVFDWERVRECALKPLLNRSRGRWRAFDFEAGTTLEGTYQLKDQWTVVAPAPVILLEGAYSASPPLADLLDLSVLLDVPIQERHQRMAIRDDAAFLQHWHAIWDEVEDFYFTRIRPPGSFDLVVSNYT